MISQVLVPLTINAAVVSQMDMHSTLYLLFVMLTGASTLLVTSVDRWKVSHTLLTVMPMSMLVIWSTGIHKLYQSID